MERLETSRALQREGVVEGQPESEVPPAPLPFSFIAPTDRGSRFTAPVLGVAFLFFGFAMGELAGFSIAQGISQLLMTSVFTFASGVILSYAGFRKVLRAAGGPATLDPLRVGASLGCFSLGLVLGTPGGVYARCNRQFESWLIGEQVEHSQCRNNSGPTAVATNPSGSSQPGIGPMGAAEPNDNCKKALVALEVAAGDGRPSPTELVRLISEMRGACQLGRR